MRHDRRHDLLIYQPRNSSYRLDNKMEHDTEQSSSDVSQECRPGSQFSLFKTMERQHEQHHAWMTKSAPTIPTTKDVNARMHTSAKAVSYHEYAKHVCGHEGGVWMGGTCLQRTSMISSTTSNVSLPKGDLCPSLLPDDASQRPLYSTIDDERPPLLEASNISVEHDYGNSSSVCAPNIDQSKSPLSHGDRSIVSEGSISVSSSEQITHISECVPVQGRLIDLLDHAQSYLDDDDDTNAGDDEGGIVILDESTEKEFEESMRRSLENDNRRLQLNSPQQIVAPSSTAVSSCTDKQSETTTQASTYENDSILLAAAARVNASSVPLVDNGHESLGFEQLLQEADNHIEASDIRTEVEQDDTSENVKELNNSEHRFWRRNPFSSSDTRAKPVQKPQASTVAPPLLRHTPVRATRISHDKYVVEIDIVPSNAENSRFESREVVNIMANMDLLHLWFDPVPAVFEATVTDGSGNDAASSNSLEEDLHNCLNNNHHRQHDGQWVEISTPPLTIPSDSRISSFLRAIRVGFRSMIGFPARIRSMIFVERSGGRIGMTLGPYPDGILCFQAGTMAYHTFTIRMSDHESGITAENGQCIIISDEVRLQRGCDNDFNGTRIRANSLCGICSVIRLILGFLEWALFFRWCQPDLASYMQQTISSMNKLRAVVERGESAAYAGGELIVDGDDWEGTDIMGTPLLG